MIGVGTGAREDCRELSGDICAAAGVYDMDCREVFRGFEDEGVGVGLVIGPGSERILDIAIGSAGLLGV